MRSASHACDACGGTGNLHDQANCDHEFCHAVERCPVCLGAGRISDVMPARDAIADAETLRQNDTRKVRHSWGAFPASFEAAMYPPLCADPEIAYLSAKLHARAAFRAVPGLRGE